MAIFQRMNNFLSVTDKNLGSVANERECNLLFIWKFGLCLYVF